MEDTHFEAPRVILYSQVVLGLSALIMQNEQCAANERAMPGHDPDVSDDRIKLFQRRAESLRSLRQQFEKIMCEVAR